MRLVGRVERVLGGGGRLPLVGLGVAGADGAAQRPDPADRSSELLRQLSEHALGREVAPRARDLLAQHTRVGEVLEEGDDVGEGFV